ncbi:ABC transporter substrate-binding protein [Saccharothrix texasensis]|uniref:Multiple sugar transport system substrate-binding protein n=1 Tax=Saccharothrix texasensis TaxID=103734 RepID=A0A3N1GX31_9PSEU|nr:sugar ABC transporter substrate-binding protein [Saccharothrix texasensis]ROP34873.1 multiple sugar transport system substrate-binding protein [Saccharothrix texasensis]
MIRTRTRGRQRRLVAVAAAIVTTAALTACGGADNGPASEISAGGVEGVDDGATLTLWTRAPLEFQANLLVEAYNKTHKNKVELTITPNDDYVSRVGAAAGSGDLPDLFAADIVYVPNWTEAGLFSDVTEQIKQLPHADKINKGHLGAGTRDGKQHVLPFVLDLSVMFWNKALYQEAGLDPEKGPATLAEFAEHAKAVQRLDREGVYGTSFGGNCGGCNVFTWFPTMWASGDDPLLDGGAKSGLDSPSAKQLYGTWRDLWAAGAVDPASRDETGATWVAAFQQGKIGVMPYPATLLATADKTVDVGVAPIPGVDGGGSTFLGGDGIGISKDSKKAAQAWNFLSWLMSEEAQVGVLAANNSSVARSDLADNEHTRDDPRLLAINEVAAAADSRTPTAVNFQQAFNAAGSPWVTLLRNQVFGDAGSLAADNAAVSEALGQ